MVSIIVPVYNTKKYLSDCLDSIKNQTYRDFEVIIIDDGSTDGSSEICDDFAKIDTRFKVFHNKNMGVSASRNYGLEMAEGEYIAFCDADDAIHPDYLYELVTNIEQKEADIVICSYYYRSLKGDRHLFKRYKSGYISTNELFERIFICDDIGGFVWNKLFRKSTIGNARFDINLQICEDTFFICEIVKPKCKIYFLNKPLYYYLIRQDSATNSINSIITNNRTSKYSEVFNKILANFELTNEVKRYIKSGIFIRTVSVKCNYKIANGMDKAFIRNLNSDARKNFIPFIFCEKISFTRKIITLLDLVFNVRRFRLKYLNKHAS